MRRFVSIGCLGIAAMLFVGCGTESAPPAEAEADANAETEPFVPSAPEDGEEVGEMNAEVIPDKPNVEGAENQIDGSATAVEIEVVDTSAFGDFLKDQGEAGKLVAIDCWATWCVPCRKKFPHFVEIAKAHHGEAVTFVSLSFDDPSEMEAAREFLVDHGADFPAFLSEDSFSIAEFLEFDGSIPHYFLIDTDGNKTYSGKDVEELEGKIAEHSL